MTDPTPIPFLQSEETREFFRQIEEHAQAVRDRYLNMGIPADVLRSHPLPRTADEIRR